MKAPVRDRSGGTLILQVSPAQKAVVNGTVTLDRYLEEVKKQYPSRFEDFEWVKTEKGKQGENLTLALTYKYSTSGQTVEQLQFLVWTEDHHYSLSWGCLASRFQQNRKLFEKVSGAFKPDEKK